MPALLETRPCSPRWRLGDRLHSPSLCIHYLLFNSYFLGLINLKHTTRPMSHGVPVAGPLSTSLSRNPFLRRRRFFMLLAVDDQFVAFGTHTLLDKRAGTRQPAARRCHSQPPTHKFPPFFFCRSLVSSAMSTTCSVPN